MASDQPTKPPTTGYSTTLDIHFENSEERLGHARRVESQFLVSPGNTLTFMPDRIPGRVPNQFLSTRCKRFLADEKRALPVDPGYFTHWP